jgi:hypothetical protein
VDQILAAEEVTPLASPGEVLYPLTDHLGTTRWRRRRRSPAIASLTHLES